MNAKMRRYLEDDWDEELPTDKQERDPKPRKNSTAQDRRQASKEWGRAIAKFQRSRDKTLGPDKKP